MQSYISSTLSNTEKAIPTNYADTQPTTTHSFKFPMAFGAYITYLGLKNLYRSINDPNCNSFNRILGGAEIAVGAAIMGMALSFTISPPINFDADIKQHEL